MRLVSYGVIASLLAGPLPALGQTRPAPGSDETGPATRLPPMPGRPAPQDRPQILPPRPGGQDRPQIQPTGPVPSNDPRHGNWNGGGWGGSGGSWNTGGGRGFAGRIECGSRDNRENACYARADNRVVLVRQLSSARCVEGRSFYATRTAIRVRQGCRGEFLYGYGNYGWTGGGGGYPHPDHNHNSGPSTGAVIAGVAVAGGLIALLSQAGKPKSPPPSPSAPPPPPPPGPSGGFRALPPAAISADLGALPAEARPVAQTCLFEAARQVGVTGGSRIAWDRLIELQPGNGGYRIRANLRATYPDGERDLPIFCRATPTEVLQLDFS